MKTIAVGLRRSLCLLPGLLACAAGCSGASTGAATLAGAGSSTLQPVGSSIATGGVGSIGTSGDIPTVTVTFFSSTASACSDLDSAGRTSSAGILTIFHPGGGAISVGSIPILPSGSPLGDGGVIAYLELEQATGASAGFTNDLDALSGTLQISSSSSSSVAGSFDAELDASDLDAGTIAVSGSFDSPGCSTL